MNIERIPDHIIEDLKERGWSEKEIERSYPDELFNEYCEWQGLSGYGDMLREVLDALRGAQV